PGDLELEAPLVVAVVDADPRPGQRMGSAEPGPRERTSGAIARARGRGDDARVEVAVGVCERGAVTCELCLACDFGAAQLLVEDIVGELRQTRVRGGVRTDLPASVRERAQLVPGHQ